ncbi:hypothetical protein CC79DRAFT_1336654 [Sarocladium strictum]
MLASQLSLILHCTSYCCSYSTIACALLWFEWPLLRIHPIEITELFIEPAVLCTLQVGYLHQAKST